MGAPEQGVYRNGMVSFYTQRKWVREFGGAAHGLNNLQALALFVKPLLTFSSYTLTQKFNYSSAESLSMQYLEEPMLSFPLQQQVTSLDLPLFILQGKYDQQTVTSVTRDYFESITAPHKQMILFENSAHLVPYEERTKFHRVMVEQVLPFAEITTLSNTRCGH